MTKKIPMSVYGNQDQGRENKVAPLFKEAVEIMYGEGISKTGEPLKIADSILSKKREHGTLQG